MLKIYIFNGRKVWLDEDNLPEGAIPCGKPKKVTPAEEDPQPKAKPAPANKAKKVPTNKSRKAGSNK